MKTELRLSSELDKRIEKLFKFSCAELHSNQRELLNSI